MTMPASFTDSKDFNPPCSCGHDFEDHEEIDTGDPPGRLESVCTIDGWMVRGCPCAGYDDEPDEPDPDRLREERF